MLAIFSTALAFFLYYRAMETTSATTLSMDTYLVPVVATIVGVVVLNEQLVWSAYLGFALVILGIVTVNGWFNAFDWSRFSQRKENLPMTTNKMERLTETIVDRLRVKQFGVEWLQQA